MKALIVCLLLIASAASVAAQPIHGHPLNAAYASPAEWPTFSAQTHWAERDVNPSFTGISDDELAVRLTDNRMAAHTHVDAKCPANAEVAQPFDCTFVLTAFHTDGTLDFFTFMYPFGHGVAEVGPPVWDATGNTTKPALVGDPNGVKIWTGHFTVTPTGFGWFLIEPEALTGYRSGSQTVTYLNIPAYSVADRTQPEEFLESDVNAASSGTSPRVPNVSWSGAIVTRTFHPLMSVSRWVQPFATSPYGSAAIPEITSASFEQRRDMDLHNGVVGASVPLIVTKPTDAEGAHFTAVWNDQTLGSGTHKVATIRYQQLGLVRMSTLLVETVTIDPAAHGSDAPVPAPAVTPPVITPPPVVTPPPPTPKTCPATAIVSDDGTITVTLKCAK